MQTTDELMADALAQLQEHTGTLTQAQAALERRVAGHERRLAALEQVLASLRARVAELESRTGWIACTERMPPAGERVLVWDWVARDAWLGWVADGGWLVIGDSDDGRPMDGDSFVSHWMPLPGEPQAGVEDAANTAQ